jgi:Fe-S oxidoreductase
LSLHYLKTRNRLYNTLFRKSVVEWGANIQRLAADMMRQAPQAITDKKWRVVNLLKSPMMPPSKSPLRATLPSCSLNEALLINPPGALSKTVFYFPGCGSERLYADIAAASIYSLLKTGTRVILPPSNLCCGFPAKANAKSKMHSDVTLRDTIILSQIREMLGHINFNGLVISCGTCRESLHELGAEEIFNCDLVDVGYFVLEQAPKQFTQEKGQRFLYHAPCHDSLQGEGPVLLRRLAGQVDAIGGCCSEAGTLALSRPDIACAMLQRKRDNLMPHLRDLETTQTIVTNCPSCISGLGRNRGLGVMPRHLAVLLAESLGGTQWHQELKNLIKGAEIVTF